MTRILKTLFCDTISWVLLLSLSSIIFLGMTSLFNRYERVECFRNRLHMLEYDIQILKEKIEDKKIWVERLETDPAAWEQVARERMNYLAPDEVLVTFIPS